MSAALPGRGARRGAVFAVALSAVLLVLGLVCLHRTTATTLYGERVQAFWPLLIPAYVLATRLNLAFQRRDSNLGIALVQLPLAIGVVLFAPWAHLGARIVAVLTIAVARRLAPFKAAFNLGMDAMEVGVAYAAVALAGASALGPRLWLALLVGLVLGDVLSCLAMNAASRLLGLPVTREQFREHLVVAVVTSTVFTGLAVLTLSAVWTDPSTIVVVVLLAAALTAVYRAHRRMSAERHVTEELYAFVKDLGPVDVEQPEALHALQRVRVMLHAEHLDLSVLDRTGGVSLFLAVHREGHPERRALQRGQLTPAHADVRGDCMTAPLLAGSTVLGLLVARQRIGSDRGFDMRDFRLLEAIAAELATALDRGRLLRELGRAASTDAMTGLPNLRRTTGDLEALLLAAPDGVLVAAVAVDSFREVNDTLGHEIGDELLREVARRLHGISPDAVVGRVGGGRFAIAVPTPSQAHDAAMFGLALRARLEGEADLGPVGTSIRVSVGCVRAPDQGRDAETLLRRAETAMYSAQHAHGGPVLWEPAYEVQGQRRLAVVMALREALCSGAVGVAFQPKVQAVTGECTGVEALARWTHPALGDITPDEFVPLAEAAGLMNLLTSTVLRQAVQSARAWRDAGVPVGVAVNVSADTLQDRSFVTDVARILAAADVPADVLTLELTEDVVVADPQLAAERMHELRALGVKLSVDDFGTGYSSLMYLKGLPIDQVKIDKGFVAGLVADSGDQAVVRAVVDIAHTLGMSVVAEGVEQEDQHALLRRLGVDEVQGYLHARPMPGVDMATWLARQEIWRS